MNKGSRKYLSKYITITPEIEEKIKRHCKRYNIEEDICAWYKDKEDFYSDWSEIGYSKTEANKILHGGIGEFMVLTNGNILRFVI